MHIFSSVWRIQTTLTPTTRKDATKIIDENNEGIFFDINPNLYNLQTKQNAPTLLEKTTAIINYDNTKENAISTSYNNNNNNNIIDNEQNNEYDDLLFTQQNNSDENLYQEFEYTTETKGKLFFLLIKNAVHIDKMPITNSQNNMPLSSTNSKFNKQTNTIFTSNLKSLPLSRVNEESNEKNDNLINDLNLNKIEKFSIEKFI